jgi:hypothetical protein
MVHLRTKKIPTRVCFGGPWNIKRWYSIWNILKPFGKVDVHLVYLSCGHLMYFFTVLVSCTDKNLATLLFPLPIDALSTFPSDICSGISINFYSAFG